MLRLVADSKLVYRFKRVEPFASAIAQYDPDRNSPVTLGTGLVASDDEFSGVFGGGLNIHGKKVTGQVKYQTQQFKNEVQTHSFSARVRFNF